MPNLTIRYIVSLAILIPLAAGSYFLLQDGLKNQLSDSRVINIAGRQRMLSQKISKTSLEIQNATNETERNTYKKELEEGVTLWEKSHRGLQMGDEELGVYGKNSKVVKNLFIAVEPSYQLMLGATKNIVKEIESGRNDVNVTPFVSIVLSNEATFLSGMDEIVFQYDKEAKTRVENLGRIELLLLWVILLTIIMEGTFVLRPAVKKLKEADKLKDEFISIASHQLRTPLTSVQWVVERLIKKETLSDKGREYVGDIMASMKNLASTVNILLNVSRLDTGKISARLESIDLVDFIQGLIDEYAPIRDKKNLRVSFHHSTESIKIETDKSMLRNIMQAILSNALEYTPNGGKIEVTVEKTSEQYVIIMRDSGIGISKKDQSFLFQKFRRGKDAEKIKPGGYGLGLYIAKRATQLLGGRIRFESEEAEGSTFYVEIPLKPKKIEGYKLLS